MSGAADTPGRPLDPAVRRGFEARIGYDFSKVSVHTDREAAATARAFGARAYTAGRHIVFGEGQFEPASSRGRALLAHELVHVVQQRRGGALPGSTAGVSSDAASEREANEVARGGPTRVDARAPAGVVQRQPLDAPEPLRLPAEPLRLHPTTDLGAVLLGSGTIAGFATNSASIPAGDELARLAGSIVGLLAQYPGAGVSVIGHTDAVGEEAANVELGQRRADGVASALAAAGIPRSAIDATSAGEGSLAVPTPRADPRNRRVEVVFRPRTIASRLTLGTGTLTPPGTATGAQGPIDFGHITLPPERPDYFRAPPTRPGTAGVGPLIQQRYNEFVDPIINGIGLPDWMASALREAAHGAPGAAGIAALNQAMGQLNVPGEAQEAIRAGVRAAMQTPLDPGQTAPEPIRTLRPRPGTLPLTDDQRFAIDERAEARLSELHVRGDAERRRRIVRAIREAVEYADYDHLDVVLRREGLGRVDRDEIHIFVAHEADQLPRSPR